MTLKMQSVAFDTIFFISKWQKDSLISLITLLYRSCLVTPPLGFFFQVFGRGWVRPKDSEGVVHIGFFEHFFLHFLQFFTIFYNCFHFFYSFLHFLHFFTIYNKKREKK